MLEAFHGDRRNADRWQLHPLRAKLRQAAKDAGLWNLWIPAAMAEELRPLVSGSKECHNLTHPKVIGRQRRGAVEHMDLGRHARRAAAVRLLHSVRQLAPFPLTWRLSSIRQYAIVEDAGGAGIRPPSSKVDCASGFRWCYRNL